MDTDLFTPAEKRKLIVYEWRTAERPLTRAVLSVLKELPDWELILLRTKPLSGRPSITPSLRDRVHVRTALSGAARAPLLNETAIFVPGLAGLPRLRLEAQAAGAAIASPPGVLEQPALAAAALARLAEDDEPRTKAQAESRGSRPTRPSRSSVVSWTSCTVASRGASARSRGRATRSRTALDRVRPPYAHVVVARLPRRARRAGRPRRGAGLGAIAVTDHNAFGGALQAAELAADRALTVIPGEEIKTAGQGEVIGLFLQEEIPRGLSFEDTIAAIRAQGGLVYLPTPSTACMRSRMRRRCTGTSPTSTSSRSTTHGSSSSTTTRPSASPGSTT